MSTRDPRDVRNRGGKIIMPGQAPGMDEVAANHVKQEDAMKNHPFFRMIENLERQGQMLAMQNRVLASRFNGLMDYLNHIGLLLSQPHDIATGLIDETAIPTTPEGACAHLVEDLVAANIITQPINGVERYIEEHVAHAHFMSMANEALQNQEKTMLEVCDIAREFNENPRRIRKVQGDQFQLPQWLTKNPDSLTDEELDALAAEFGLAKHDDPVEGAQPDEEPTGPVAVE